MMERYNYNNAMPQMEAHGIIEVTLNGCNRHQHPFVMTNCEAGNDCGGTAYTATFRTETCDGHYYEMTGRIREVQVGGGCHNDCGQQNNTCSNCPSMEPPACGNPCGNQNNNTIWPECGACNQNNNSCGCNNHAGVQDNAFTWERLRPQQRGNLLNNWLRKGDGF